MQLTTFANAACESFMKTLKQEEVYRNEYRDFHEAKATALKSWLMARRLADAKLRAYESLPAYSHESATRPP